MVGCCLCLIYAFITKQNIPHFSSSKHFISIYSLLFIVTLRNITTAIVSMKKVETERIWQKSHSPCKLPASRTSVVVLMVGDLVWTSQRQPPAWIANTAVCPGPQLDDRAVELAAISHSSVTIIPTYWWNCSSGNVLWSKTSTDTAKQTYPQPSLLAIAA